MFGAFWWLSKVLGRFSLRFRIFFWEGSSEDFLSVGFKMGWFKGDYRFWRGLGLQNRVPFLGLAGGSLEGFKLSFDGLCRAFPGF